MSRALRRRRAWRIVRWPLAATAIVTVAIQFVPYGWWHENPPLLENAPWPSEQSASIARQSCYSCHSNETNWPPYSYVAPMSWLVRSDVETGRAEFNFSDWARSREDVDDAIDVIADDEMPPRRYTMIHRNATLTTEEADVLVAALLQMGGGTEDAGDRRSGDDDASAPSED